jgi:hypothetical protein
MRMGNVRTRFEEMRIDKMVGARVSSTKHVAVQEKGGVVIAGRIGCNHGSIEIDIGRVEMVEYQASVRKVGERKSAETDELKGVELCLGVANGEEKGLDLLQMLQLIAFRKYG